MLRLPSGIALRARRACLAGGATLLIVAPAATAFATAAGAAAGAAAQHDGPALATIVQRYQGCLTALPASDRALLQLRFGTGAGSSVSDAAAAARTHTSLATFTASELRAIRRLEKAHRAGRCDSAAPIAVVHVQAYQATRAPPLATTPATSSGLSWTSPTELVLLAIIALACGALVYGLRRDFRPHHGESRGFLRRRPRSP